MLFGFTHYLIPISSQNLLRWQLPVFGYHVCIDERISLAVDEQAVRLHSCLLHNGCFT